MPADRHLTGPRLRARGLTKEFGGHPAVSDLSFEVLPGRITGFLGPNGAGKTTTIRMLLGLVRPDAGSATFDDSPFAELGDLRRRVGVLLDSTGFPAGTRASTHLRTVAMSLGRTASDVERVVHQVDLGGAIDRSTSGFSLGMKQRLLIAEALLTDPLALVLDEPTNGLDPQGVHWLRSLLRSFADDGRTVFVSSHLLAEVEQSVDDLVVVNRGRCVYTGPMGSLRTSGSTNQVAVVTDEAWRLADVCRAAGLAVRPLDDVSVGVEPPRVAEVARLAGEHGIVVRDMVQRDAPASLEQRYLDLIAGHERELEVSP